MKMIPDNIKREILAYGAENIVSIIGEYVPLRKTARAYVACCPFHAEKTPSFTADPGRKTWHCFGSCGEGGDVAKFLMKIDGISFPVALERLAIRGGITIPNYDSGEERERRGMLNVLAKVQRFYHNSLLKNQNGAKAYVGTRMTDTMVRQFGIGFAPVGGKVLVDYLDKERLPLSVAEKAGLIRKDAAGNYRDTFRGRVMFPIKDKAGYIIAFAGRTISATKSRCKYINSPETPLFRKSATLFGLDGAIEAMKLKGEVYVVEGYIDLMQMWSAGINNVVATCGTAFTREHAALLKRYVRRLNLMFDGDDAGRKALQKSILLAVKEEMKASVFIFPEGQDPDSFYRNAGKTETLITMSGFDFLKQSGVEMNATMQNLHRLERLETGFAYMAKTIPGVARLLAKRGNLGELFCPEILPIIEETINHHGGLRK
ncbi:MAG: DNA primase [Geobacter sp.]|nr:DNA primase [Geobacter sp.]